LSGILSGTASGTVMRSEWRSFSEGRLATIVGVDVES
jgi:hypothetical protein